jgi:glycosyltransferase involved in cell wall biosynthesis
MVLPAEYKSQFKALKCCVLIPTYNNATTIAQVVQDVLQYSDDVCVVNDGSTDGTPAILAQFPQLKVFSYEKNKGKGWALRNGFDFARRHGYEYAITIDSDGQHYADDLPVFIEALKTEKNAILIGARNMNQASVPGKSSFGNKFSNFWFRFETGIDLPDTQSGYRLYPIKALEKLWFFTRKYEFEIEVIVRAAWSGIEVKCVPVKVYYPPAEERITHFRPFQDFSRISVLNTILVTITLLWIKPRNRLRFHLGRLGKRLGM